MRIVRRYEVARGEPWAGRSRTASGRTTAKTTNGDAAGQPARRVLPHPSRRPQRRWPDRVHCTGCRHHTVVWGGGQKAVRADAALDGRAPSWAIEHAGRQITVNVERAGPIETPMLADPVHHASAPKLAPLGRFVQCEEVADLVAFLLGPSGCSITGQRLVICGGASL
jgi:NAD(P)-dependent dehydrogenase (short-subunit alcohol dehydrogenase family)